jgi:transposase
MTTPRDKAPSREKLIELRFEKGMTREGIAEHFDVSIATVRRWIKEMEVPRPSRRTRPKRPKHLTPSGEIVAEMGDGYNRFERARIKLEGRVIDYTVRGYCLDGTLASAEEIIEVAQ